MRHTFSTVQSNKLQWFRSYMMMYFIEYKQSTQMISGTFDGKNITFLNRLKLYLRYQNDNFIYRKILIQYEF